MRKQLKKLTLTKETLRDLTAQNAGEVKGGKKKTKGLPCLVGESVLCDTNLQCGFTFYICGPTSFCGGR